MARFIGVPYVRENGNALVQKPNKKLFFIWIVFESIINPKNQKLLSIITKIDIFLINYLKWNGMALHL